MRIRTPKAVGAVAAQGIQAFGSFLLQVLAARQLGAASFGTFAFLFGGMIMATAVSTGLIGDSLTVLDRHSPQVRAALWRLTWVVVGVSTSIGLIVSLTLDTMSLASCAAFGAAMAAFMVADLCRRLLMARLRFWSLVLVDATAASVALGYVGVLIWRGSPGLTNFLLAMLIGQLTACTVALLRLPSEERCRAPRGWGAWREVIGFGSWRAAQQFVRPTMLNLARWVVLVAAGQAAVGELEAARVLVAPAMLLVQGVGSYLFSTYAADRDAGMAKLLARADRAAAVMLVGAMAVGAAAAGVLSKVSSVVTAGRFDLSVLAVLGWACYAASCAAVLPYGSLAAVGGRQRFVFVLRVADSIASLVITAGAVLALHASTDWVPWLLSVGSIFGGLLCRQVILRPSVMRMSMRLPSAPSTHAVATPKS